MIHDLCRKEKNVFFELVHAYFVPYKGIVILVVFIKIYLRKSITIKSQLFSCGTVEHAESVPVTD
jgi:hypothetical protein